MVFHRFRKYGHHVYHGVFLSVACLCGECGACRIVWSDLFGHSFGVFQFEAIGGNAKGERALESWRRQSRELASDQQNGTTHFIQFD